MTDVNKSNELSDQELVRLTLVDQNYFTQIIIRYKFKLLNYLRRITGLSYEDAEDVLQDVFLKAYLNLNSFDSSFKFSSWIYALAHNQAISNHRKLKARAEGYKLDLKAEVIERIASDFNLINEIDKKISKQKINETLEKIELKYREVLVLKFLEEKSYEEISDILKKPVGTVGSLINQAKKEFKKNF